MEQSSRRCRPGLKTLDLNDLVASFSMRSVKKECLRFLPDIYDSRSWTIYLGSIRRSRVDVSRLMRK